MKWLSLRLGKLVLNGGSTAPRSSLEGSVEGRFELDKELWSPEVESFEALPSPCQTPRRIPWRCLKFSTQPELALNLSSEILRVLAISLALLRINESESVIF